MQQKHSLYQCKNDKQLDISGKKKRKKFKKQECNRNIHFISLKIINSWTFPEEKSLKA